jgi:predicted outer membrane repeat protein
MKNGVAIYGGFSGNETSFNQRANYNYGLENETILSGDIGTPGNFSDDCYHIFYHPSSLALDTTAILDGFTIMSRNSHTALEDHNYGGGIFNESCSPKIVNCYFISNRGYYGGAIANKNNSYPKIYNCYFINNQSFQGGAIYNYSNNSSTIAIKNCVFNQNLSYSFGGGIYSSQSSITINSCLFNSNQANQHAGGVFFSQTIGTISNSLFIGNSSTNEGGAIYSSSYSNCDIINSTIAKNISGKGGGIRNGSTLNLKNSIVWLNKATQAGRQFYNDGVPSPNINAYYSCYSNQSGDLLINSGSITNDVNTIFSYPIFADTNANDFKIVGVSPCVDVGNNSYSSDQYDLRGFGYERKLDKNSAAAGVIDMGCFEYKLGVDPVPVELISFNAKIENNCILLKWSTASEINNYGFEIERSASDENKNNGWKTIGFVRGAGNSSVINIYKFEDKEIFSGKRIYRLKQIDFDGNYKYFHIVEIDVKNSKAFILSQNYPNPFNPSTTIEFVLLENGYAELKVFNALGEEISCLMKGYCEDGKKYSAIFNGNNLTSGIYYYVIKTEKHTQYKKIILMK